MKLLMTLVLVLTVAVSAVDVEQALVKVYGVYSDPNYYMPWQTSGTYEGSGSGCIIEDNLILTNAHVVANVTYLRVRREGDPKMYQARVVQVAHDADLALITVDNPAFFEDRDPLQFGDLPDIEDEVRVYGYPMGGDALSITQGVVSRIENHIYTHSGLNLLCIQIDAPINPGNSGGPVIENDKIIGVAMQVMNESQSIGYVVPTPVIMHFFEDIEDGEYDGFPSAGFNWQGIENESITDKYGIGDPQTGILVNSTTYDSPSFESLFPGDVVMEVDGYEVAGDGTIELREGTRTPLSYLFQERHIGESISVSVIRDGELMSLELILDKTLHDLVMVAKVTYDVKPVYVIYGGLTFTPLSLNFLMIWGDDWFTRSYDYFAAPYKFGNRKTVEQDGIVVLGSILSAPVNSGYEDYSFQIVEKVNDEPVTGFAQFVELVDNAEGEFIEFMTNLGNIIILDREEAITANPGILRNYSIQGEDRYLGE